MSMEKLKLATERYVLHPPHYETGRAEGPADYLVMMQESQDFSGDVQSLLPD